MTAHTGQLSVSSATVEELVATQFPAWRRLPIERVQSDGTVNTIYRIGPRFAARFPLEPADAAATRRRLASGTWHGIRASPASQIDSCLSI